MQGIIIIDATERTTWGLLQVLLHLISVCFILRHLFRIGWRDGYAVVVTRMCGGERVGSGRRCENLPETWLCARREAEPSFETLQALADSVSGYRTSTVVVWYAESTLWR